MHPIEEEASRDYVRPQPRDMPTLAPPARGALASDLRSSADRIEQMAMQMLLQAGELRGVADRIEGQ